MAVPKCRECDKFKVDKQRAHKEHPSIFCHGYYCYYYVQGKALKASEIKTSPKWCPLRKGGNDEAERTSETP
jgi:hypothetical protein